MNGAQAVVEMLKQYDTEVIFGVPGDTSVPLYDALYDASESITHVMARDERSAAFMADVYSRLTNRPGICEGPSGGGATYMLPGVTEANGSSVALIALTTDNPLDYEAQGALTDLDQPDVFSSVTKWSMLVKRVELLPGFIRRAFRLATSGPPGAVHLALPKDVLDDEILSNSGIRAEDSCKNWPSHRSRPDPDAVERAARVLLDAERPAIVAGGGAVSSRASEPLSAVSRLLRAPVATTINGKGAVAETNQLSLGVIGSNGGRPYAHEIVRQSDVVLFVGSKVNYVDTDNWRVPPLANPPKVLQIDVDPAQIGNTYPIQVGMCGDAKLALQDLLAVLEEGPEPKVSRDEWLGQIADVKRAWREDVRQTASSSALPIRPQRVVGELHRFFSGEALFICDPGTPTPFMAAEFELDKPGRRVISPRAQGGLGYAIPGVVGARLARPDAPVIGLCGDGSFAISAGDLATVGRMGGPTVIILFNNGCYGWIKALQRLYHNARYFSVDFTEPLSYTQIAEGFGLRATQISNPEHIGSVLEDALGYGEPYFIEMLTAGEHDVIPPVAAWQRQAEAQRDQSEDA